MCGRKNDQTMNVTEILENMPAESMVRLISKLYGTHMDIDNSIERHIEYELESDVKGLSIAPGFIQQIRRIADECEYIGYRAGDGFACRLSILLLDINTLVRPKSAAEALNLTEEFIMLAPSVFERADDSDGVIAMVFRSAVDQWLAIATEYRRVNPNAMCWVDKVRFFFDYDDYGCFDHVISQSQDLLAEKELRQLAREFEIAAYAAKGNKFVDGFDTHVSHACIGIKSVAEALDDMQLYEKGVLITSPQPNSRQLAMLVSFALEIGDLNRAQYWIQQPRWQGDQRRQKLLQDKLLQQRAKTKLDHSENSMLSMTVSEATC